LGSDSRSYNTAAKEVWLRGSAPVTITDFHLWSSGYLWVAPETADRAVKNKVAWRIGIGSPLSQVANSQRTWRRRVLASRPFCPGERRNRRRRTKNSLLECQASIIGRRGGYRRKLLKPRIKSKWSSPRDPALLCGAPLLNSSCQQQPVWRNAARKPLILYTTVARGPARFVSISLSTVPR
jgi:hypothetical protein